MQDPKMSAGEEKEWWAEPAHFSRPLVFYVEADQEELVFGHGDSYLRPIEMHSQTLIQLEPWFTASGQTRVTVVGRLKSRQWLMNMFWSLGSQNSYHQSYGREMLERVRSQPLTTADLDSTISMQPDTWDLSLAARACENLLYGHSATLLFPILWLLGVVLEFTLSIIKAGFSQEMRK